MIRIGGLLLEGLNCGFHIIDPESQLKLSEVANHKSAMDGETRPEVERLIVDEIKKVNYVRCTSKPDVISALGAVPKSDGGICLVHDLSLHFGKSVIDYSPEMDKCTFESVDTAVSLLQPGYYMVKIDLKAAYRHVPIHPNSQRATGLKWPFAQGHTVHMYDAKLPFGARASPTIFHLITQTVKRMLQRRGHEAVVVFQDDFLVIGRTYDECLCVWLDLINLLLRLGFDLNFIKLVAPTKCLKFLGLQLNTNKGEISLPQDKFSDIKHLISTFLRRERATKRQLQSPAGKLNFAARVVRGGRTFLRRILDCIESLRRPHHKARIAGALKQDLLWWHSFLYNFNGVAAFPNDTEIVQTLSDACTVAGGMFCNGDFAYLDWGVDLPEASELPINYKETVCATLAVIKWAPSYPNRRLNVYLDNQCAVSLINKCVCRNGSVMAILREMFWSVAIMNCAVRALYMPGVKHRLADTISRLHEPGQLLHLESQINEWYMCHLHVSNGFMFHSLLNHMSMATLCCIFAQVQHWQRLRHRWTGMSGDTENQHLKSLVRRHLVPS